MIQKKNKYISMKLFSLILVFSSLESGSLNFKEFQMEYFKIFPSMPFSLYNSFNERHFGGKKPKILLRSDIKSCN